ncbi:MAG: UDP-N-acetylmuramoyl-L-alanine--D-glutamate ligase [Candidatus Dormibacteraeota bacterium]|nr:UDP-N-acetylmuramoyl-L-alanine--D-glutamate ligase [Candidatus Dormibacteraeota bacterium]
MTPPAEVPRNLGDDIGSWEDLFRLRDAEVHVVGAGSVEGAHLLLFLADHGFTRLTGHDFSTAQAFPRAFTRVHVGWPMEQRKLLLDRLLAAVDMHYRDRYLEGIEASEAIAVTQGWYLYESNRPLAESEELQRRFFSLVQLYLGLAPGPVIGVTGSQGKSTTTRLLRDILVVAGRDVIYAGNDRHSQQALDLLEKGTENTHLVLEISNRHLKLLHRSPSVAVVTNVYPNHLEEHGGWEGYVAAKTNLVRHQRDGDIVVLNADLDVTRAMAAATPARRYWFGETLAARETDPPVGREPGVAVGPEGVDSVGGWPQGLELSIAAGDIPVAGTHNALNVAAAAAAALAMGVGAAHVEEAVGKFRGLKHRIQFIWSSAGARYFDDLNSTTPTATEVALRTLGSAVIWILGGEDKGLDSSSLARTAHGRVKMALALPGGGTEAIVTNLEAAEVDVERVEDFGTAVRRAVELAGDGDSVLLSPACPGFFSLYYVGADEDTGFKRLVREATLPTSPPARKPRTPGDPG